MGIYTVSSSMLGIYLNVRIDYLQGVKHKTGQLSDESLGVLHVIAGLVLKILFRSPFSVCLFAFMAGSKFRVQIRFDKSTENVYLQWVQSLRLLVKMRAFHSFIMQYSFCYKLNQYHNLSKTLNLKNVYENQNVFAFGFSLFCMHSSAVCKFTLSRQCFF